MGTSRQSFRSGAFRRRRKVTAGARLKSVDDGNRQMVTLLGCVPAASRPWRLPVRKLSISASALARGRDPAPAATLQTPDSLRL